jgi:subtilisin family serine protease
MKNKSFTLGHIIAACCLASLSVVAFAQIGTPDQAPAQQPKRGGFGISLDLGSLVRAVSNAVIAKYESPDSSNQPAYEPRQIIVAWLSANQAQASAAIQSSGGNPLASAELPSLGLGIATLQFASDEQANAALAVLQGNAAVIASRHARSYLMQAGSPSNARQYAHELIKAPAAASRLAATVSVGIIDTEISNAATMASTNVRAKRFMADGEKASSNDHGSAVAAVIAGTGLGFEGVAQGVSLRSAGVMREIAPGLNATNTMLVAQALDWMISEKVQIINLSLGSADDQVLAEVVKRTLATGAILVAAAGNGGPQAAPSYPAAYPGVISVTAVDARRSTYTRANRGTYIAIAAPGVDVWIPTSNEAGKGKYMSGTSFAAPFVTAAIARAAHQGALSTTQALQALCSRAAPLNQPASETGCGLLQY